MFVEEEAVGGDGERGGDVAEGFEGGCAGSGFVASDLGDVDAGSVGEGFLGVVVEHYRATLDGSPEVWGWLERRRIAHPEVLEGLGVGFSDRSLVLPSRGRRDGAAVRAGLRRLGVLRGSGHEHFWGCVTFPVYGDAHDDNDGGGGGVVQVYGRMLSGKSRDASVWHRWLPVSRRGVWNRAGLTAGDGDVVVCEGIVDAVSLMCAGFGWVTACEGPGGFDDELETAIVEAGVGRVVVAFDGDEAGDAGALEVAARLGKRGVSVARAGLPRGLDVNEVAVRAKQPADALAGLLRQAVWIDSTPPPRRSTGPISPAAEVPFTEPVSMPELESPGPEVVESELEVSTVVESPGVGSVDGGVEVVVSDGELEMRFAGGRRWRVRGLGRVSSFEVLKLNVLVSRGSGSSWMGSTGIRRKPGPGSSLLRRRSWVWALGW